MSDSYLHWEASTPSAVEILRRARDLVAFGWCQGADATDAEHRPTQPWSSHACYWSLPGALAAALDAPREGKADSVALIAELRLALIGLSKTISDWSLQDWNDAPDRTQLEVVEMLNAARRRCVLRIPNSGP